MGACIENGRGDMILKETKIFIKRNKGKLIISLLLIGFFVFALISFLFVGSTMGQISGLGTENNPYKISTAEELIYLSEKIDFYTSGVIDYRYFTLVNDIDLGGIDWTPIGTESSTFAGVFDGNGYTISNCNIISTGKNVGFFSAIWEYGSRSVIKNLTLTDMTMVIDDEKSAVGGLVGEANADIINCNIDVDIYVYDNCWAVGGIVGSANGDIENCVSGGSLNAVIAERQELSDSNYSYPHYSGVVGVMQYGYNASNLTNNKTINVSLIQAVGMDDEDLVNVRAGGVIGQVHGGATYSNLTNNADINCVGIVAGIVADMWSDECVLTNCKNYGNLYGESAETLVISGIVGTIYKDNSNNIITNCLNAGNISGVALESGWTTNASWCGGILGFGTAYINACKSTGDISVAGVSKNYVGGIAGGCNGTVTNSYCTGDLTINTTGTVGGGIVGILQTNIDIVVENCFYTGEIIDNTESENAINVGYILGYNSRSTLTVVANNYYDSTILGDSELLWYGCYENEAQIVNNLISNNVGLDTQTMQSGNLNGFIAYEEGNTDSNAVWIFEDNSYPKLYWE